jgi:hypothetical protein
MSYETEAAARYRQHAAKLRSLAADYEDKETIELLIGVARDYECMAQVIDGRGLKNVTFLRAGNSN